MDKRCSLCNKIHSEVAPKSDNEVEYRDTPVSYIRDYMPGFIGGCDIAKKATDEEVILICQLQDKQAILCNDCTSIIGQIKILQDMISDRRV